MKNKKIPYIILNSRYGKLGQGIWIWNYNSQYSANYGNIIKGFYKPSTNIIFTMISNKESIFDISEKSGYSIRNIKNIGGYTKND